MDGKRINRLKQLIIQLLEDQENVVITVLDENQTNDKTA